MTIINLAKKYRKDLSEYLHSEQQRLISNKSFDDFKPGDVVDVEYKQEGLARTSIFEGIVLSKVSKGLMSSFSVLKISAGVKVVKTFILHHSSLKGVKMKKIGKRNRAKLYYLLSPERKVKI